MHKCFCDAPATELFTAPNGQPFTWLCVHCFNFWTEEKAHARENHLEIPVKTSTNRP